MINVGELFQVESFCFIGICVCICVCEWGVTCLYYGTGRFSGLSTSETTLPMEKGSAVCVCVCVCVCGP